MIFDDLYYYFKNIFHFQKKAQLEIGLRKRKPILTLMRFQNILDINLIKM